MLPQQQMYKRVKVKTKKDNNRYPQMLNAKKLKLRL